MIMSKHSLFEIIAHAVLLRNDLKNPISLGFYWQFIFFSTDSTDWSVTGVTLRPITTKRCSLIEKKKRFLFQKCVKFNFKVSSFLNHTLISSACIPTLKRAELVWIDRIFAGICRVIPACSSGLNTFLTSASTTNSSQRIMAAVQPQKGTTKLDIPHKQTHTHTSWLLNLKQHSRAM